MIHMGWGEKRAFDPFELLTCGLLQKEWDHSPPRQRLALSEEAFTVLVRMTWCSNVEKSYLASSMRQEPSLGSIVRLK